MKKTGAVILILFLFLFALPLLILLLSSFSQGSMLNLLQGKGGLTLEQYQAALESEEILLRFKNSAVISAATLTIQLPVSLLGGFYLVKQRKRRAAAIRFFLTVLLLLPFQSIMVPVFRLSKWTGLYDSQMAVILPQAFSALGPLAVWLLVSSLPEEQWEAAQLDTASHLTIYARVILPQLAQGLCAVGLLCFAEAWNLVEQPLILLSDETLLPASLSLNDLELKNTGPYAGAALYSAPVLLLYAASFLVIRPHLQK